MVDKLASLLKQCKCGVFLIVNEHRDYYQTASDKIAEIHAGECDPQISDEVMDIMIETDTIVDLQFYPDTPIGSYSIYHYDLDKALDEALECIRKDRGATHSKEGR